MEHLREVVITAAVDTNKGTYRQVFTLGEHDEDETVDELLERSNEWVREHT